MVNSAQGLSLRISLTTLCQLRCTYCVSACPAVAREGPPLSPAQIVRFVRAVGNAFELAKVHLTGGEPLLRPDIADLVRQLAGLDVPDLALTTNGQRLGELAEPLYRAGLRRVNVSLDSLDEGVYSTITRGGDVKAALEGIVRARSCGLRVKTNTVVLRGVNDGEVSEIARWGMGRGCQVRFLELMPIGPAAGMFNDRYVPSPQVRRQLGEVFDLKPLPGESGGTARQFLATDGRGNSGIVGFISSGSEPFCHGCRRLRLTASGRLIGCLALGMGIEIGSMLRSENYTGDYPLIEAVHAALDLKRTGDPFITENLMIQTGG